MPRWTGGPDSTVILKLTVQTPDLPIEPPRPLPPQKKDRSSWSFPIKFLVVLVVELKGKNDCTLFFWGGPTSIWNVQTAGRSYWVPYTFSNHSLIVVVLKSESKANLKQTRFCLFGLCFFCFRRIGFGKRICKLHWYVFRYVTYWIHLATHRRADVEEALAEGFPVAWFTSLQALVNLSSYPFSHLQTLISLIVITFHVVGASVQKIYDF